MSGENRAAAAAEQFREREGRSDGPVVVERLTAGLSALRDLFFTRIHAEVEQVLGVDSMLVPVAEEKSERLAKSEIEIYLDVEAAAEAEAAKFATTSDDWLLHWLLRLRLGDECESARVTERVLQLWSKGDDERRKAFTRVLERTFPEAARAPLVLFRLVAPAACIVADVAFGDAQRAQQWRRRQQTLLPALADCRACHGDLLECGESCNECGNPLWKYEWLTAD